MFSWFSQWPKHIDLKHINLDAQKIEKKTKEG